MSEEEQAVREINGFQVDTCYPDNINHHKHKSLITKKKKKKKKMSVDLNEADIVKEEDSEDEGESDEDSPTTSNAKDFKKKHQSNSIQIENIPLDEISLFKIALSPPQKNNQNLDVESVKEEDFKENFLDKIPTLDHSPRYKILTDNMEDSLLGEFSLYIESPVNSHYVSKFNYLNSNNIEDIISEKEDGNESEPAQSSNKIKSLPLVYDKLEDNIIKNRSSNTSSNMIQSINTSISISMDDSDIIQEESKEEDNLQISNSKISEVPLVDEVEGKEILTKKNLKNLNSKCLYEKEYEIKESDEFFL